MVGTRFFIENDLRNPNNFIPHYKDVFDYSQPFNIKIEGLNYAIRVWRDEELVGTVTVRESPPYTYDKSEPYRWAWFLGEIVNLNSCNIESYRKLEYPYTSYHLEAKIYYNKKTRDWAKAEFKILDQLSHFE